MEGQGPLPVLSISGVKGKCEQGNEKKFRTFHFFNVSASARQKITTAYRTARLPGCPGINYLRTFNSL